MLSPLHLCGYLAGFLCGWPWGIAVGFITPALRSLIFGMPPLVPTALIMSFEIAAYGLFTGLFFSMLRGQKMAVRVYAAMVPAMLLGRIVWGVAAWAIYGIVGKSFTLGLVWTSAFVGTWPGVIMHLVLVPLIVLALHRAKLLKD